MRYIIKLVFVLFCLFGLNAYSQGMKIDLAQKNQKIVTLDFKRIDVRELLQFIAESMGFNVIISDAVSGVVTLHFFNMSWQQALDTVLDMTGYVKMQHANILQIATAAEFAKRQQSLSEAQAVKRIKVKFFNADVKSLEESIRQQTDLLSPHAKIIINPNENSVWVKENVDNLPYVVDYLRQLDSPEKQVLVAAKIINIDCDKSRELGLSFNVLAKGSVGNEMNLSMPEEHGHNFAIAIATLAQKQLLNLQINALETTGNSKMMAAPKLITGNKKTAVIEAGEEIPYQENTSSGATSTAFKKAALSLKVTPTILPDNRISLILEISQNKTSPLAVNGNPAIQTQELKTQIILHNDDTVILGGIFEESLIDFRERLPVIGKIPVLGTLLSYNKKQLARKELLILVSPRIISEQTHSLCY